MANWRTAFSTLGSKFTGAAKAASIATRSVRMGGRVGAFWGRMGSVPGLMTHQLLTSIDAAKRGVHAANRSKLYGFAKTASVLTVKGGVGLAGGLGKAAATHPGRTLALATPLATIAVAGTAGLISSLTDSVRPVMGGPGNQVGSGSGFLHYGKGRGRPMPANHLGATGDMTLALHRTRHR